MKIELRFYGPPRRTVGDKRFERDVPEGTTVRELFEALVEEYPDLSGWLLSEDGEVPSSANITINQRSIELAGGLDNELDAGDVVRLAPMLEGG